MVEDCTPVDAHVVVGRRGSDFDAVADVEGEFGAGGDGANGVAVGGDVGVGAAGEEGVRVVVVVVGGWEGEGESAGAQGGEEEGCGVHGGEFVWWMGVLVLMLVYWWVWARMR